MCKKKKQVVFHEDNNEVIEFERNQDKFKKYFRPLPPKASCGRVAEQLGWLRRIKSF